MFSAAVGTDTLNPVWVENDRRKCFEATRDNGVGRVGVSHPKKTAPGESQFTCFYERRMCLR